jgi:indole-3-acetate monooxygenase
MNIVPDVVTAARRLVPRIVAMRDEAERLRHVPQALSDALAAAGLYQMFLPRSLGGLELSPLTVFEAVETVSAADGSVGWCVINGNFPAYFSAWLAPDVARDMFGTPPTLRAAGSLRPQGRAWPVAGGYRVKGQWNFVSGLHNATWLYCTSLVMDGDAPRLSKEGTPVTRAMWIPAAAATFLDTWSVMGMRGSGSHDFVINDVFVPASNTGSLAESPMQTGTLYHHRALFAVVLSLFSANALGIARGAIDSLMEIATQRASTRSPLLLKDRPDVHLSLGQAEAITSAARSFVTDSMARFWKALCEDDTDLDNHIARTRLSCVHAIHESLRAVDLAFHTAGTNAIYTANPLERHFRDIHVAVQHNAAFKVHYESAGKVFLGLRPTEPGW